MGRRKGSGGRGPTNKPSHGPPPFFEKELGPGSGRVIVGGGAVGLNTGTGHGDRDHAMRVSFGGEEGGMVGRDHHPPIGVRLERIE